MPVRFHYHRHPGCGTKCNTACSTIQGREGACFMSEMSGTKGEYFCTHVYGEPANASQIGLAAPSATQSYVNADGDTVSVSAWSDTSTMTICANGTTTVRTPDGTSESVNDPLNGAPVYVAVAPDGTRTTEFPNGSSHVVGADGTVSTTRPDGTVTTVQPDGQVIVGGEGRTPTTGLTLEEAIARGHLSDAQIVSTGENLGNVAVLVGTCDGAVPFVFVPPSILTPDDAVTNQTLDTHPTVVDTSTPGAVEVEIPGACRNDPALPPAPSGDTGVTLTPTPLEDPTPHIGDIVEGAVTSGVVPDDLVGTPQDTIRTLDQVTRWLRQDATPEQVIVFLQPRIPGTPEEKQQTAQEIVDWGSRLVDKTRNLDKQIADVPEIPPGLMAPGAPRG